MAVTAVAAPAVGTFHALRSSNFRLYFFGQMVSQSGTWMQNIAQGYLVYSLTGSEAWLGIVALAAGLPVLLMSPLAGVIVEMFPRRHLLVATNITQMSLAAILTVLAATNTVQVWHVVVLAFILGMSISVDAPSRQTFMVEMVGREDLPSALALNSILNSSSRVLGPMAAGAVLAQLGVNWCFFINAVSFLVVLGCLIAMHVPFALPIPKVRTRPMQQLREGFAYVRHDPAVRRLLMLSSIAGFFLLPIFQMMPAIAETTVDNSREGYALLSAAQGVGSIVAGLLVGWLTARYARISVIGAAMLGAAAVMALIGMQTSVPGAVLFAMASGLCMVMTLVNMNLGLQLTLSNAFRGRVLSLYMLTVFGLSPFGALALGMLAEGLGVPLALQIYGGAAATLAVLVFWRAKVPTQPELSAT
ncbi:MAG: MFS transporter [Chloroflexi bacterium]|nr:MFS transporter [Chloroflexota bacterium]